MRITKIRPQKRKPGRHTISFDDRVTVDVSAETLLRMGLRSGDEISSAQLKEIEAAEQLLNAKRSALRLLSYRARTVHEMRDRLRTKKIPEKDIDAVITELEQTGLLDDRQFSLMYVRSQLTAHPSGKRLLKQKLRLLGVGNQVAGEVLDEVFQSVSQEDAATSAARKYLRTRGGRIKETVVLRKRLAGFLARRGFSWDVIASVTRSVINGRPEEDPE